MRLRRNSISTIVGLTVAVSLVSAYAQTTSKLTCMSTGSLAPEAVGDRDGHFIQSVIGTCTIEGGPLDGAVMTQNTVWDADKGTATIPSGNGVVRKPGGVAVYQTSGGTRNLVIKDGKVAGWMASGKGVYTMATGTLSAVSGKTFSWTGKSTGFNQYSLEAIID